MKNSFKVLLAIALMLALGAVSVAYAEDLTGSTTDNGRGKAQDKFDKLKDLRERKIDVKENILEVRTRQAEEKNLRASTTGAIKNATTSAARKQLAKTMRVDAFKIRQTALVRNLRKVISTLESISVRLDARIDKATAAGRTMDEAEGLLATANIKIADAKKAVDAFANLQSTTSTTTTATTTSSTTTPPTGEVDLDKPRKLAETAIKAVAEARDALKDVVRSVAHNMGLGGGNDNATTTPPTATTTEQTSTTTPPTATTTNPVATTTDPTSTTTPPTSTTTPPTATTTDPTATTTATTTTP